MGEKINGGSEGKKFADSSFQSPDLNCDTSTTTTTATTTTSTNTHHYLILQDFLTRSSARGDQANSGRRCGTQVSSLSLKKPCGSSSTTRSNQPLNRSPSSSQLMYANSSCFLADLNSPFAALTVPSASTTTLLDPFLKRCSENHNCSGDRRYKRMMKNRESAARSRSRRMAYTIELEKKKIQLTEENDMLRRLLQRHELLSAAAAAADEDEAPNKLNLTRSLSARF